MFSGDPADDPRGNVQHIAGHEITTVEVEEVLEHPLGWDVSHSSGRRIVFGETAAGRLIAVVFTEVDRETVYPHTAFELEP